jgi:hypothetical protein
MKFNFKLKDVAPLIDWEKKNSSKSKPFASATLRLVGNFGVCLMSGCQPMLMQGEEAYLAYAKGCGPETHHGGSDFVDPIEVAPIAKAILDGAKDLEIELTETSITVTTY